MALLNGTSPEEVNNHLAHIIRDVFNPKDSVVIYGTDHSLIDTLRSPEHSIESWGIYTEETNRPDSNYVHLWNLANNTYFGTNFCNLLLLTAGFSYGNRQDTAIRLLQLMKQHGKVVCMGSAAFEELFAVFTRRQDLELELTNYSLFGKLDFYVLEKR